ncbi:PAS domain S-box protein [Candidatus Beckwithbacteria bacterium]|nr:PAS domain S-box protein [Candidatus Beckwithbacteria bacterium]
MLPDENNNLNTSDSTCFWELAEEWFWKIDASGLLIAVSPNAERITGYKISQMIGKPLFNFVDSTQLSHYQKVFTRISVTKKDFKEIETILLYKNKKAFVEISGKAILGSYYEFLGVSGICRDISKYGLLEKQIEQEREKYMILSQLTSEALVIHSQGQILEVNNTFLHMFAYHSAEEVIGKNPLVLIAPESKDDVNKHINSNFFGKYEFTAITKDKKLFFVETNIKQIKYENKNARLVCIRNITKEKLADEELSASEERFRAITAMAQDIIILLDQKQRIVFCNPALENILGYTEEEIKGIKLNKLVRHGDSQAKVVIPNSGRLIELQIIKKDKTKIYIELSISPVKLKGELYFVVIIHDINRRKNNEQLIKDQNNYLESLIDSLPIAVFGKNPVTREFTIWNKKAEELFGLEKIKVIGKSDYDFFPKKQADYFHKVDSEVIRKRKILDIPEEEANSSYLGKRLLHTIKVPIVNEQNQVSSLLAISEDITARRQEEEALFFEKEYLDITLRSIGDGVITTDVDSKITHINQVGEVMTGWKESEAQGKPFAEIFNIIKEDTGEKVSDPVRTVLTTGETLEMANHTQLIAKNGKKTSIANSCAPIKDYGGKIKGAVLVFRDVTTKKLLQEKLLKQVDLLKRFKNVAIDNILTMKQLEQENIELKNKLRKKNESSI